MKKELELIRFLADKNHVTPYEIGKNTSISVNTVASILKNENTTAKPKSIETVLDYLLKNYSDVTISPTHVYKSPIEFSSEFKEPDMEYGIGVPYYDIEFAAGFEDFTHQQLANPTSFIKHPFFEGCDFVIRASGQSMSKVIKHGDAIGVKEIKNWQEFLPYGEIYAIVTKDNFRMIKVITKGETEDTFTLISKPADSKKDEFPPQQIKKSLILAIYKVQASSYLF